MLVIIYLKQLKDIKSNRNFREYNDEEILIRNRLETTVTVVES